MSSKKRIIEISERLFVGLRAPILAILVAFAIGAIPILAYGANPLIAYQALLVGAFGSIYRISETLRQATPLLIAGSGWLVSFRCGVYSLGTEGQMLLGALFGTVMALTFSGIPLLLPVVLICGFLGGALWGGIVGVLKAKLEVSELISTVMMNYIAYYIVYFAVLGPFHDPDPFHGEPDTFPITSSAWLPRLLPPPSLLHIGFLMGLVAAPLFYIFLTKTTLGYRIRVVGANPEAAHSKGIGISKTIIISMLISGGMAGLAGMVEISGGITHRLGSKSIGGVGWTAIFATLLAYRNPLGLIPSSILFSALIVGAKTMAYSTGVPIFLSTVLQALTVLFVFVSQNIGLVRKFLSKIK